MRTLDQLSLALPCQLKSKNNSFLFFESTWTASLGTIMKCQAWTRKEISVHKLKIDPEFKPVKQTPRRMRVELEEKVTAETLKLRVRSGRKRRTLTG